MAHKNFILAMVLLSACSGLALRAQILHATGPRPSFEVVTIKPSDPGEAQFSMGFTAGGRGFQATNATVLDMVQEAWNVKSTSEIEGASGWMTKARFDIAARMTDAEAAALAAIPLEERITQARFLLQSLLQDRCGLKLHSSVRVSTYFELMQAKGGEKMKPTEMAPADPATGAKAHPLNAPRIQRRGRGQVEAKAASISTLTDFLARLAELGSTGGFSVGELIVDKTGLSGAYDWTLNWTPQNDASADTSAAGAGPSLYTALQEQLGLQLKKTKGQVEVLIIDHVERPTEN
ncbi:MAG TPA: TIGR03435 family protein [Acidobacteriaceae bacterium]|nr:TIGR03435 family protein [Acidobacteriaceae bacterium]